MILKIAYFRIQFIYVFFEAVIVFPKHGYICVVIPRNITLVANCTEETAAKQNIINVVITAYPIEFYKHVQFY